MKWKSFTVLFIVIMRSIVVGISYYSVRHLPGLTSSFVSIFVGFLAFDLSVAIPKFSLRLKHWRDLFLLIVPRMSGVALSLITGITLGVLFGGLTTIGLPILLGAILTLGFSYSLSAEVKGNISNYVGMIAGIEMFDQIQQLNFLTEDWVQELAGPAGRLIYATFLSLILGWFVGVLIGTFTRLLLPRGYRSVKSSAYAQPLWMRSFKDVIQLDDGQVLLQIELSEKSAFVYHTLAESGLGKDLQVNVLSIIRPPNEVISPRGDDVLLPLDQLIMILPASQTKNVMALMKGRVLSE